MQLVSAVLLLDGRQGVIEGAASLIALNCRLLAKAAAKAVSGPELWQQSLEVGTVTLRILDTKVEA